MGLAFSDVLEPYVFPGMGKVDSVRLCTYNKAAGGTGLSVKWLKFQKKWVKGFSDLVAGVILHGALGRAPGPSRRVLFFEPSPADAGQTHQAAAQQEHGSGFGNR